MFQREAVEMQVLDLMFEGRFVEDASRLPSFLGPTIRGAFGITLKNTVCQFSHRDCSKCVLARRCAYPIIFEGLASTEEESNAPPQNKPQPFVLLIDENFRLSEQRITWGVRLFGSAVTFWPSVIQAFHQVCENGLGSVRARVELDRVTTMDGQTAWSAEDSWNPEVQSRALSFETGLKKSCSIRWIFKTPVCGVEDSKTKRITGVSLILNGRRRHSLLQRLYANPEEAFDVRTRRFEESEFTVLEHRIRHWNCSRFSQRKQTRVELWGLQGEITIHGPWHETGPWMATAPWLHIGKSTSFGCGRVEWQVVDD